MMKFSSTGNPGQNKMETAKKLTVRFQGAPSLCNSIGNKNHCAENLENVPKLNNSRDTIDNGEPRAKKPRKFSVVIRAVKGKEWIIIKPTLFLDCKHF